MTKVITYGTFDMLHYGHIKLLERAKSLGDYLIVGVTSDDFDKTRGKINSRQTLMERIAAIENTGIADEVIIEEYEGQKIDDIIKYNIDIFTVGSDWVGKFDYLNDYCKVIYLPRTQGVSSSNLRANTQKLKIGLLGDQNSELTSLSKFIKEVEYVNGVEIVCSNKRMKDIEYVDEYFDLLEHVDAVYITTHPKKHYQDIKTALLKGKHVLCESPITVNKNQCQELFELAQKNNCVLMEGIKTAYSTAYSRLILLAKSGKIGEILSVDATCTTLKDFSKYKIDDFDTNWNTITEWGSLALMPIVQILGTTYLEKRIVTRMLNTEKFFDGFTKIDFLYKNAVASLKVAKAAKSEGELIITGTDGYIYVPSPWWKTDYFEVRYENPNNNQRYFYQLDGEGIRYEIVAFAKAIATNSQKSNIRPEISITIAGIMDDFYNKKDIYFI